MSRMGELNNYAIILMNYSATRITLKNSAGYISNVLKIPLLNFRRVLKTLLICDLLRSMRKAHSLNGNLIQLSMADITTITAAESLISITECNINDAIVNMNLIVPFKDISHA